VSFFKLLEVKIMQRSNESNLLQAVGVVAFNTEVGATTQEEIPRTVVAKRDEKPARGIILRGALFALALLCMHTLAWGQSCELTLAKLRSGEQPLIGGYADWPPFVVVAPDGRVTGMDPEIFRAIAGRLGIKKVELKPVSFSRFQQALQDKTIDIIVNPFWKTPERERLHALTIPYYIRGGIGLIWVDGNGPFNSVASMVGKRIAVLTGSMTEGWLLDNVPTATILRLNGPYTQIFEALANKQVDVAIGMYTFEEAYKRNFKTPDGKAYRAHLIQPMQNVFALRKGCNELRQAFDDTLKSMWDDGSLFRIKDAWLGPLGIVPAKKLD
jgi:polar amino acid transport system substrate-binding protein